MHGTARGDGSAPVIKSFGLRWSRNLGAWFVPQSRDRDARTGYRGLDLLKDALEGAGFEVELSICNERRATEDVIGDRLERSAERAERLDGRAERLAGEATSASAAAHRIMDMIPSGQPVLVGHHSEKRHRRDLGRIDSAMGKAVQAHRDSEATARAADSARATVAQMDSPRYVQNRIEDAARDMRAAERGHRLIEGGYTGPLVERLAEATERHDYWCAQMERIKASGTKVYTKADIAKGDAVLIRHGWCKVARANAKTVAVETEYSWTMKYPYAEIRGHRTAAQLAAAAAAAEDQTTTDAAA